MSGRAPFGSGPSSDDVDGDGAVLDRRIDRGRPCRRRGRCACRSDAGWPMLMSLACVSAILSSALSRDGFGDARQVRARRHLLADFDRDDLQHAREAGPDVQFVDLPLLQLHRSRATDRLRIAARPAAPASTRRGSRAACWRSPAAPTAGPRRASTASAIMSETRLLGRELLVHLRLQRGLLVVGLDAGGRWLPAASASFCSWTRRLARRPRRP